MDKSDSGSRMLTLQLEAGGGAANEVPMGALSEFLGEFAGLMSTITEYEISRTPGLQPKEIRDIRRLCAPRCRPPQRGSYAVPAAIGAPGSSIRNAKFREFVASHQHLVPEVLRAAGAGREELLSVIPDSAVCQDIQRGIDKLDSHQRNGVRYRIRNGNGKVLLRSDRKRELTLEPPKVGAETDSKVTDFCGVLQVIGVRGRYLKVDLLQGDSLRVSYDDFRTLGIPVSDDCLIQVTGRVRPRKSRRGPVVLDSLVSVAPIAEFEFTRRSFTVRSRLFVADPPLKFRVTREDGVYVLTGDLDVNLAVTNPADLRSCLDGMLSTMWEEFAEAPPDQLSGLAKRLQVEMQARVKPARGGV